MLVLLSNSKICSSQVDIKCLKIKIKQLEYNKDSY